MKYLINGQSKAGILPSDRGLTYGDGVFRTIKVRAGKPLWWDDHYLKLTNDCSALDLVCPEPEQLLEDINALAWEWPDCVVKVIVTRGEGTRGYMVPIITSPTRIVSISALPDYVKQSAKGVRLRWCILRLARQPALAGVKHLNRLENILARKEWNDLDIAEGLICDDTGAVIGGTMTNVFLIHNGRLLTPKLNKCGVEGVTRLRVLRAAQTQGIETKIQRIEPADVLNADAVFLSNSIAGIWRVAQLDDRRWEPSEWTAQFRHWIDETA